VDKFSFVRCPGCGFEEFDESIKLFGVLKPKLGFIAIGALFLLIAIARGFFEQ
jgi:hypothetical protein